MWCYSLSVLERSAIAVGSCVAVAVMSSSVSESAMFVPIVPHNNYNTQWFTMTYLVIANVTPVHLIYIFPWLVHTELLVVLM